MNMELTIAEKINVILNRKHITKKELADRLETSPQNLNKKLKRDNLSSSDIQKIADAIGCRVVIDFEDK